jgi:hypothetical protein
MIDARQGYVSLGHFGLRRVIFTATDAGVLYGALCECGATGLGTSEVEALDNLLINEPMQDGESGWRSGFNVVKLFPAS